MRRTDRSRPPRDHAGAAPTRRRTPRRRAARTRSPPARRPVRGTTSPGSRSERPRSRRYCPHAGRRRSPRTPTRQPRPGATARPVRTRSSHAARPPVGDPNRSEAPASPPSAVDGHHRRLRRPATAKPRRPRPRASRGRARRRETIEPIGWLHSTDGHPCPGDGAAGPRRVAHAAAGDRQPARRQRGGRRGARPPDARAAAAARRPRRVPRCGEHVARSHADRVRHLGSRRAWQDRGPHRLDRRTLRTVTDVGDGHRRRGARLARAPPGGGIAGVGRRRRRRPQGTGRCRHPPGRGARDESARAVRIHRVRLLAVLVLRRFVLVDQHEQPARRAARTIARTLRAAAELALDTARQRVFAVGVRRRIAEIDLATMNVRYRRVSGLPTGRRTLVWLGHGRLAVAGRTGVALIQTHRWTAKPLDRHANAARAVGDTLFVFGRGLRAYTRTGRKRFAVARRWTDMGCPGRREPRLRLR